MKRLALGALLGAALALGGCGSDSKDKTDGPVTEEADGAAGTGGSGGGKLDASGGGGNPGTQADAGGGTTGKDAGPADAPAADAAPKGDTAAAPDTAPADMLVRRACPTEADGGAKTDAKADGAVATAPDAAATTDAKPVAGSRGEALFLVNKAVKVPGDDYMRFHLEDLGFVVTPMQDADATPADATGKVLVLVSASVSGSKVADKFKAATVPVIVMEPFILDDMQMTGPMQDMDYGFTDNMQSEILITDPKHPMAAGFRCFVKVADGMGQVVWGKPAAAAEKVAEVSAVPGQAAIFGYKTGALMIGGFAAPARRVGWFSSENLADSLNEDGYKLFDAAVEWALGK